MEWGCSPITSWITLIISFTESFTEERYERLKEAPACFPIVTQEKFETIYNTKGDGDSGINIKEDEDEERTFEVFVEVTFRYGGLGKHVHLKTSFSLASFEGRECTCCRFHKSPDEHRNEACPINHKVSADTRGSLCGIRR